MKISFMFIFLDNEIFMYVQVSSTLYPTECRYYFDAITWRPTNAHTPISIQTYI